MDAAHVDNAILLEYFASKVALEEAEIGSMDPSIPRDNNCTDDDAAGKSVSHNHRHSAWQRTELRRVYGDTGMMEKDWAMGAYGVQGWHR